MPNAVENFQNKLFWWNNNLATVGLLLLSDIRELLYLKTTEIRDTPEIKPDFQMEVLVDARDAKETLSL